MDELKFDVFIHTMQFTGSKSLPDAEIRTKTGGGSYYVKNGQGRYIKANPNHCGIAIESLGDTETVLDNMLHDLQIEPETFLLERFDLAINTIVEFDNPILYKLNLYLASLYATHVGSDNCYRVCGNDLLKRSIEVRKKRRSPQLSIYNKNVESKGRNPANTRIEWRFVNQTGKKTMRETILDFCGTLESVTKHIEKVNEQKVSHLIQEYERVKRIDNPDGRINNFSTFVKCHSVDIFNRDILSELDKLYYKQPDNALRGRNWLRRYRKQGASSLYLVSKGEIIAYIKTMKKAIKQHLETHDKEVTFSPITEAGKKVYSVSTSGLEAHDNKFIAGNL